MRPQTDSQIIVRSIEEIDVIPNFGANSYGSGKCFNASAWVNGEARRSGCQPYAVGKTGGRVVIGHTEILKAYLAGDEETERSRSRLEFWPEESMQRADVRSHRFSGNAVGKCLGIGSREIVAHLRFYLNAALDIERRAAAQAYEVFRGIHVGHSKIFGKSADLDVVGVVLRQQRRGGKQQQNNGSSQIAFHVQVYSMYSLRPRTLPLHLAEHAENVVAGRATSDEWKLQKGCWTRVFAGAVGSS